MEGAMGLNRTFRAAVAALMLAVGFAGSVAAEDAAAAYHKGDYATALRLMRPLAEQGEPNAQYMVGSMYDEGKGVPQDYTAAMRWFRKAAEQGFAVAQFTLGFMYSHGHGVSQNDAAAVSWYRKAARQGYASAQTKLGVMYFLGQGVPQDSVLAHMWFNLAAAGGEDEAAQVRDRLAPERMTPVQIAEAQKLAREWKPK
jgi:uncharacterized protein